MAAPVKIHFPCFCTTLVISMLILKALTHLVTLLLFRSPIYTLHVLAVCAIQCKVVLFLFGLVY